MNAVEIEEAVSKLEETGMYRFDVLVKKPPVKLAFIESNVLKN